MPQVPALQARAGKAIDMGHVAASGAMARRLNILEIVGNAIVGGQETYVTRLILEGNDNATSVKPGNDRPKPMAKDARRLWSAFLAAALLLGAGIAMWTSAVTNQYLGPDPPRYVAPSGNAPRPRVALVLSGGGPRGFAHVGVIRALEQAGIRPDLIVGSSAGALVGALYASGRSGDELNAMATQVDFRQLFDFVWYLGRVRGRALQDFVNASVQGKRIEQLPVRFATVATRMNDGAPVIFDAGDTGAAVRASASTQTSWIGKFSPLRVEGVVYADGDISSPLPTQAARTLGAAFVIAVDVSAHVDHPPAGSEMYRESDLARRRLIDAALPYADVVVHPDIGYWAGMSAQYREQIIAVAYREATRLMPGIKRRMQESGALKPSPHSP